MVKKLPVMSLHRSQPANEKRRIKISLSSDGYHLSRNEIILQPAVKRKRFLLCSENKRLKAAASTNRYDGENEQIYLN